MRKPISVEVKTWPDEHLPLEYSEIRFGDKVCRYVRTNHFSRKRIDTLCVKEPTTIAWMDCFAKDDVFFDIGANVGMYTIYAAVMQGCRVISFEPEALNYAELNKNIHLNDLHRKVTAYCAAVSDEEGQMRVLHLSSFRPAFSHHDFGENRFEGPVTKLVASAEARPRQGCVSVMLDGNAEHFLPQPTHIKIDVDGLEWRIISGGEKCLKKPTLKTVLIETDLKIAKSREIIPFMQKLGWRYSLDQVTTTRTERIPVDRWNQWVREGKGGNNIIWYKDEFWDKRFHDYATKEWEPG